MGYLATKEELISIIRRFDLDGDAKINIEEFEEGIKSKITETMGSVKKSKGIYTPGMSKRVSTVQSSTKKEARAYTPKKKKSLSAIKVYDRRPKSAYKTNAS